MSAVCYLVLAHTLPSQLGRLLSHLGDEADVLVHVDRKVGREAYAEFQRELRKWPRARLLGKRYRSHWGGFGLIEATLEGMGEFLALPGKPRHLCLLSGQEYPIKPPRELERLLASRPETQFIKHFPLDEPNAWPPGKQKGSGYYRVHYYHFHVGGGRFVCLRIPRAFPYGLRPYGGSQWWCLTRECIQYVLSFLESHPLYTPYFRTTLIPDETFFHTLLLNSPFAAKVENDNLRYTAWDPANPRNPKCLTREDLAEITRSPAYFARKFDPTRDSSVLDAIDRDLLQRLARP